MNAYAKSFHWKDASILFLGICIDLSHRKAALSGSPDCVARKTDLDYHESYHYGYCNLCSFV